MSVYIVNGLGGLEPPSVGDWKPPCGKVIYRCVLWLTLIIYIYIYVYIYIYMCMLFDGSKDVCDVTLFYFR